MSRAPKVGDYGTVATNGWEAKVIRFGTNSPVNHAFVYVGNGQVVEAQPGGARIAAAVNYPDTHWSNLLERRDLPAVEARTRSLIAQEALSLIGTPYGWPDIAALVLHYLGINSKAIDKRIERDDRLICSQLVDRAYQAAGVHLFADGRLTESVTPGDLYNLSH